MTAVAAAASPRPHEHLMDHRSFRCDVLQYATFRCDAQLTRAKRPAHHPVHQNQRRKIEVQDFLLWADSIYLSAAVTHASALPKTATS